MKAPVQRCPLQGTSHYPCGVILSEHGSETCQFYNFCKEMQEDLERFQAQLRKERKNELLPKS